MLDTKEQIEHQDSKTLAFYCRDFFSPHGRWAERMRVKGHNYSNQYFSIRRGHLDNYIIPAFGSFHPSMIKRRQIDNWFIGLCRTCGSTLAGATKNKILYTFNRIFEELIDLEIIEKNPIGGIVPYKKETVRPRGIIDRPSLSRLFPPVHENLLRIWHSPLWLCLMMILNDTGSRPGEIRALTWGDIDLKRRFIPIRKGIQSGTTNLIKGTKTGSVRIGFLTVRTVQELENYKQLSKHNEADDFVFTFNGEKPVSAVAVIKAFRRGLKNAGINEKRWTPYWLRHSFGTYQMEHLNQTEIMKLMGHHTISVTHIYQHPDDETLYQSAEPIKRKLDMVRE